MVWVQLAPALRLSKMYCPSANSLGKIINENWQLLVYRLQIGPRIASGSLYRGEKTTME